MRHFRLVIVGAGTAGLAALNEARRYTDRVLLINDGPYGTTCARVGCMPSKALLAVAGAAAAPSRLAAAGLLNDPVPEVDLARVMAHVRQLRDHFVAGPVRASAPGEHSVAGRPRFIDANTLEVNGETLTTDATLLATGTRPILPPAWQALGDRVVTSDSFFELEHPGRRVAVVGLGPIGVELGQGLARLGVEVHGITRGQRLAGLSDPLVSEALAARLGEELSLTLGETADLEPTRDGVRVVAGGQSIVVDRVLVALGRRPNLEGLGLEGLGLDPARLPLDPTTLQVGALPLYLAGDVSGLRPLMHEAADEGRLAAWQALRGGGQRFARRAPLAIVFTEPGAARVGLGMDELPGNGVVLGGHDFGRQGRARMEGRNHGLLRLYVDRASGRLLGSEMAIPEAEHIAHLLAWCLQQELDVERMLQMPFYHPVVEEGLRSALQDVARQLGPRRSGPGLPPA